MNKIKDEKKVGDPVAKAASAAAPRDESGPHGPESTGKKKPTDSGPQGPETK